MPHGRRHSLIIVLTTFDLDEQIYKAIEGEAMSYLLKDSSINEIVRAVHAVHERHVDLPEHLQARLDRRKLQRNLSERECEILELLVAAKTNKEIGNALFISEDTVKTRLKPLFVKLEVHDRTEAVVQAVKRGLVRLP